MLLGALVALVSFQSSAPAKTSPDAQPIEARVDPRVELLTIVARLAGFDEFDRDNSKSPYSEAVEKHFGAFRSHAAITEIQKLRGERGVSFDAIPSFAVHVSALPELAEKIPFDANPERFDARWGGAGARTFLTALHDFARESHASDFFEQQKPLYTEVGARLSTRLSQSKAPPWFDAFFGAKQGAVCTPIAGLLCGGGNFGVGVRFPDGKPEEIVPVFGCWSFDAQGVPVFDESYLPLFIHELCHTYTNPFVDRHEKELAAAGARIHATCAEVMKRQAYGTWKTMIYESLVRASVVRCRLETEGKDAAREQAAEEVGSGFLWVPELAQLFGDYASDRAKHASFDAFMPRVVTFFEGWATKAEELQAKRPKIVSLEPANDAQDVDPSLTKLVITFDRPMTDRSWSFVGKPSDQPTIDGQPAYDAEHKVLALSVKLEKGRSYRLQLNSSTKLGFKAADGTPLEPTVWRFRVRE